MRILKFRIYNKKSQKFVTKKPDYLSDYCLGLDGKTRFLNYDCLDEDEDCIVQQFTGLLDKSSREIYEGDIVKYNSLHEAVFFREELKSYTKGYIEWWNDGFAVLQENFGATRLSEFTVCHCCPCALEIIGNIFNNQELIK